MDDSQYHIVLVLIMGRKHRRYRILGRQGPKARLENKNNIMLVKYKSNALYLRLLQTINESWMFPHDKDPLRYLAIIAKSIDNIDLLAHSYQILEIFMFNQGYYYYYKQP
ncbi:hypothetical protein HUJ05_006469 [Dendroctonus ponderosae]|nr:hypothetical protein HUJ05_006469 [Dendroctonus ponderosae]